MPFPQLILHVKPTSAANGTTFRNTIEAAIVGKPVRLRYHDWDRDPDTNVFTLRLDFVAKSDLLAFRDQIVPQIPTLRTLVNGTVSKHMCSHEDVDVFSCSEDPRAEFQEWTI
jgi:hypothetical protein